MSKQALLTLSAVAALCVLATLSIQARASGEAAGQEGMVVVRDPQTGKMRAPTPDEMKALRAATPPSASLAARPAAQPGVMTRPSGARGVHVGESHLVYEVVTRGADGKLSSQCIQGEAAAQEALTHPANAADKESDHESR
jgi:hypothetical protein